MQSSHYASRGLRATAVLGAVAFLPFTTAADESASAIEEIEVRGRSFVVNSGSSATKTTTPVVETPQSISVINSDLIDSWNAGKLTEAMRYVPGVQAEPFGIEPRFTNIRIRGFNAATTGFFRDGLVLANPDFAVSYNLEPYGAERLEIPRGPASVLYGRGSPGGLVNYISKRPTIEPIREIELELGNFDRIQGQFDFSGTLPSTSDFSYRLTGAVRDADTQIDFVEEDRVYIAPALSWRPRNGTEITVLASHQQDDTMNSQALPAPGTLQPNPNGRVSIDRFTGEPDVDEVDRTEYSIGYVLSHEFSTGLTFRQNLRYNVVDLNDTVVFSNGIDPDLRTINRGAFGNFGELDGFTVDSNLLGHWQHGLFAHEVLFGVDYQHIDARSKQQFGGAPPIDIFDPVYGAAITLPPAFKDDDIEQQQVGIYLQDQVRVADRWLLTFGVRHDEADSKVVSRLFATRNNQDDSETTWRAGLSYLTGFGLVPYFSYSESFLPSVGTDASGRAFDPESGRQYEVGLKYQPPSGIGLVTLALFDLERDNVVELDPATFLSVQRGRARSRGVELEIVANFDFGLDLFANYSYLDTEIRGNADASLVGNRFTQIPEHIFSMWSDYTVPRGRFAGLGVGIGVRHQGSNFGDAANTIKVPSFTVADAAVHYEWDRFRVAVNLQNFTDNTYAATCFVRAGADFCTFGEARTVRGTIRYQW